MRQGEPVYGVFKQDFPFERPVQVQVDGMDVVGTAAVGKEVAQDKAD